MDQNLDLFDTAPAASEEQDSVTLTIRISSTEKAELQQIAGRRDVPIGTLGRQVLLRFLSNERGESPLSSRGADVSSADLASPASPDTPPNVNIQPLMGPLTRPDDKVGKLLTDLLVFQIRTFAAVNAHTHHITRAETYAQLVRYAADGVDSEEHADRLDEQAETIAWARTDYVRDNAAKEVQALLAERNIEVPVPTAPYRAPD